MVFLMDHAVQNIVVVHVNIVIDASVNVMRKTVSFIKDKIFLHSYWYCFKCGLKIRSNFETLHVEHGHCGDVYSMIQISIEEFYYIENPLENPY